MDGLDGMVSAGHVNWVLEIARSMHRLRGPSAIGLSEHRWPDKKGKRARSMRDRVWVGPGTLPGSAQPTCPPRLPLRNFKLGEPRRLSTSLPIACLASSLSSLSACTAALDAFPSVCAIPRKDGWQLIPTPTQRCGRVYAVRTLSGPCRSSVPSLGKAALLLLYLLAVRGYQTNNLSLSPINGDRTICQSSMSTH